MDSPAGHAFTHAAHGLLTPTQELEDIRGEERIPFYPGKEVVEETPVKVIVIGAGLGGIITAILLSRKVRNLSYTIYDKCDRVGGTWAANTYPGVRCDVPSHAYQATFAPNTNWSEYYSRGSEIQAYYENLVDEFGARPHVSLGREVTRATWKPESAQWEVQVKDVLSGDVTTDSAHFLVNAQGRLNRPKMPNIPGLLSDFKGHVVHTAKWDSDLDLQGKRIAIIGNGASGQQILANILPVAGHIDHYVRSKVWVTPTFSNNLAQPTGPNPGAHQYTREEKQSFEQDPQALLGHRRGIEASLHGRFQRTIKGSPENEELRQACISTILERVNGDKEWLERLTPDFAPGCKRLTPGPGYVEALLDEKVSYIQDPISHASERGLVAGGVDREVDIIIAASGFEGGFVPFFPTIGLNGADLSQDWAPDGKHGYPETYFGIMAPDMPNYFLSLLAQGNGAGGSIPLNCEIAATYMAKVIRKVQLQSYRSIKPSREATHDFNDLCSGFFEDKVVLDNCNSWLRSTGPKPRAVSWWPGSGHHRFAIMRDPRWEDFDFERSSDAKRNRFAYFGGGWTARERDGTAEDLTRYLKQVGHIDLELLHEAWNE